jgi:S1-C subfamily serine protease
VAASDLDGLLAEAAARASRSVVAITRSSRDPAPHGGEALGSGFLSERTGFVVTNAHVVGRADRVDVAFPGGSTARGRVVGRDAATDLALVRVDGPTPPALPLASPSTVRVGQLVLAVGHSLGLPGSPTVSMGVVSAVGRSMPGAEQLYEGVLQTDAPINPGNSGGPLVNVQGEVVGVNTAIVAAAQGVGFAIPAEAVERVTPQLRLSGRVPRIRLGVAGIPVGPETVRQFSLAVDSGVLVAAVNSGSTAAEAGLRPGDVVTRVAGRPVRTLRDLLEGLGGVRPGGPLALQWVRTGTERSAVVTAREAPVEA